MSPKETPPVTPAPTAGELDVLSALWAFKAPLRFADIYAHVCQTRRSFGESEPASSTVGSFLRRLAEKGLVNEILPKEGTPRTRGAVRTRGGMLTPKSRSPNLAYEAAYEPGAVLENTYTALIQSYPSDMCARCEPLADFAKAIGLSPAAIKRICEIAVADKTRH